MAEPSRHHRETGAIMAPLPRGASILSREMPPPHAGVTDLGCEDQPFFTSKHSPTASAAKAHPSMGAWVAKSIVLGAALGFALAVLLLRSDAGLGPQDPAALALTDPQRAVQLALPGRASWVRQSLPQSVSAAEQASGDAKSAWLSLRPSAALPSSTVHGSLGLPMILSPNLGERPQSPPTQELGDSKATVHCSNAAWEGERAPEEPLVWVPQPDRYLLAACTYGLSSNRFKCLKHTLIAGALLNRTVVIPEQDMCPPAAAKGQSQTQPYRLDVQVFLPGLKSCLNASRGAATGQPDRQPPWAGAGAMTLKDFLTEKGPMTVDQSILEPLKTHRTTGCRLAPGLVLPKHTVWGRRFTNLTMADLAALRDASASARVLLLGDLFYFSVEGIPDDIMHLPRVAVPGAREAESASGLDSLADQPKLSRDASGYGPSPCQPLLRPHQHFINKANDFIAEYTNSHFAALHLRRGEYIYRCRAVAAACPSCGTPRCTYYSLEELAVCVSTKMKRLGLKSLFVASNAGPYQIQFLKEHLAQLGITVFGLTGVPWKQDSQEYAMTEKIVASQSSVFFHSDFSTFSDHISELRAAIGKRSCEDGPPCP